MIATPHVDTAVRIRVFVSAMASTLGLLVLLALPRWASGAPQAIDMQHVAVDLHFDWPARQAQATATLTLTSLTTTDTLRLDAALLHIESVHDERGTLLTHQAALGATAGEDGALRIGLGRTVRAGERVVLTLRYRTGWVNASDPNNLGGSPGRGLRFLQPSTTEPQRRRQVWASSEAGAVRWWLPGHDHPADLRTSELRATVPEPLQVVAGGRLVGVQHHGNGTRTYHWRTDTPEPHHRTTFAVGEFTPIPQHHETVALTNLGYPDEAAGVAASVVMHADALRFFTRFTGQPFPHGRHTQVMVQDLPWNLPGTGLSVLSENFVDDLGTHHDFQYLWDGLQSESLVQQWFGGQLPLCERRHAWLEKAMAHHLAALYTEHRHGRAEYLLWYVASDQATALGDAQQPGADPVLPVRSMSSDELAAFATGNTPYFRGATVLHELRERLGAARWQRVVQRLAARPAGQPLCTADLQQAAEAEGGQPLGRFFEQWVRRSGFPVFEVQTQWSARAQGGLLEVVVNQVQPAAAGEVAPWYFEGPIDLLVDAHSHRLQLRAQARNRFVLRLAAAPKLVHLDPQAAWLKELRHAKPDADLVHQIVHARHAPARAWASQALLARVQAAAHGSDRRVAHAQALAGALREVIANPRLYWRERFLALGQLATLLTPAAPRTPAALDEPTLALLQQVVRDEGSWLRAAALRVLGLARDPRLADQYRSHLHDDSDRVVNAAAIALGRSGSPFAFDALAALPRRPSWKNQSLISALNGLAELRDPRGRELALKAFADLSAPHWTLATPVWDHRLAAADTLVALQDTKPATAQVLARLDRALLEGEVGDVFLNLQMLATLGDAEAEPAFAAVRRHFAADPGAQGAVDSHETLWKSRRSAP